MLTRPHGQSPRLDVAMLRGLISDRVEPVPTRVGRRGWSQRDQPHPSSVAPRGNPSRIGTFIPIAGHAPCKITPALHRMTKDRHRMTPEVHRIARRCIGCLRHQVGRHRRVQFLDWQSIGPHGKWLPIPSDRMAIPVSATSPGAPQARNLCSNEAVIQHPSVGAEYAP